MPRKPEDIKKDIKKLEAELKASKDANYYAAKAKENAHKASIAAKKYGGKAASATKKGAKSAGNAIIKYLTTK